MPDSQLNLQVQTRVNGQAMAEVAVLDRGFTYGDGVFRTLRIERGEPVWWDEHIDKLNGDCQRLNLPTVAAALWLQDISQLTMPAAGVLRLTVTRGSGPRGYVFRRSSESDQEVTRVVSVWSDVAADGGGADEVAVVSVATRCCQLRLGHQPALAGIKHLNRLENVIARAEWDKPDIREGLLLDTQGLVVSGVMSNVFIWKAGELLTPWLDQCGVAGVTRSRLMRLATKAGYSVREARFSLDDVLSADEVMLTNSLIRLWHVSALDEKTWPKPQLSPKLRAMLHA